MLQNMLGHDSGSVIVHEEANHPVNILAISSQQYCLTVSVSSIHAHGFVISTVRTSLRLSHSVPALPGCDC